MDRKSKKFGLTPLSSTTIAAIAVIAVSLYLAYSVFTPERQVGVFGQDAGASNPPLSSVDSASGNAATGVQEEVKLRKELLRIRENGLPGFFAILRFDKLEHLQDSRIELQAVSAAHTDKFYRLIEALIRPDFLPGDKQFVKYSRAYKDVDPQKAYGVELSGFPAVGDFLEFSYHSDKADIYIRDNGSRLLIRIDGDMSKLNSPSMNNEQVLDVLRNFVQLPSKYSNQKYSAKIQTFDDYTFGTIQSETSSDNRDISFDLGDWNWMDNSIFFISDNLLYFSVKRPEEYSSFGLPDRF